MQTVRTIMVAVLISTALTAPLLYLELLHGSHHFPYPLFAVLWLLPAVSVFAAVPLIHAVRPSEGELALPVVLCARMGLLLVSAFLWIALVSDQMPCFLGVPSCD